MEYSATCSIILRNVTCMTHNLFSYMPHYHIAEAEVVKNILGKYYSYDNTPVWKALWNTDSYCRFVEDSRKILSEHSLKNRLEIEAKIAGSLHG